MTTTPDEFTFRKAVFYFRTHDRWPGGNADMMTIKVVLRRAPDAEPELAAQFYRCFDGRHLWYPARRVEVDAGDALAEFLAVTRSLAARGSSLLAAHVLDPAEDEWDCEWADSEVYFHATEDAPETAEGALLQLVRRASKATATPADPELERAFELARQITGVGRVFQFGNTEDALSAAYWTTDGAPEQELEYAAEAAPSFLPPETDAAFLELQAARAQAAAAARGPETLLVYRLDEVPEFLTRALPADSSVRRCLFFTARDGSPALDAMLAAVPEDEHADVDAAMEIAHRVTAIVARSEDLANKLRPDEVPRGGALLGGTYENGFHGGDADAVDRWLDAQGVGRVSLQSFLDRLILLRALDEEGTPLEQVDKFAGGPPALTADAIDDDGLYVFERDSDHVRFELAQVSDEEEVPWLELRSEDLAPGVLHTVTVPAVSAAEETGEAEDTREAAEETETAESEAEETEASESEESEAEASEASESEETEASESEETEASESEDTEASESEDTEAAAEETETSESEETEAATGVETEPEEMAGRKTTAKQGAKKAAKRPPAKKPAAKKTAAKKSAAKKPAAKKSAAKKPAAKKSAAKKPAARKTAAKKTAAKKPAAKKSPSKKSAAKKTASKKARSGKSK